MVARFLLLGLAAGASALATQRAFNSRRAVCLGGAAAAVLAIQHPSRALAADTEALLLADIKVRFRAMHACQRAMQPPRGVDASLIFLWTEEVPTVPLGGACGARPAPGATGRGEVGRRSLGAQGAWARAGFCSSAPVVVLRRWSAL